MSKKSVTFKSTEKSPPAEKAPPAEDTHTKKAAYPGTGILYDVERMINGKLYYYVPINITHKTEDKVPDIVRFYGKSPEDIVNRLLKVDESILKTGKITPKQGFSQKDIAKPKLTSVTVKSTVARMPITPANLASVKLKPTPPKETKSTTSKLKDEIQTAKSKLKPIKPGLTRGGSREGHTKKHSSTRKKFKR